eukprot:UN12050
MINAYFIVTKCKIPLGHHFNPMLPRICAVSDKHLRQHSLLLNIFNHWLLEGICCGGDGWYCIALHMCKNDWNVSIKMCVVIFTAYHIH